MAAYTIEFGCFVCGRVERLKVTTTDKDPEIPENWTCPKCAKPVGKCFAKGYGDCTVKPSDVANYKKAHNVSP